MREPIDPRPGLVLVARGAGWLYWQSAAAWSTMPEDGRRRLLAEIASWRRVIDRGINEL